MKIKVDNLKIKSVRHNVHALVKIIDCSVQVLRKYKSLDTGTKPQHFVYHYQFLNTPLKGRVGHIAFEVKHSNEGHEKFLEALGFNLTQTSKPLRAEDIIGKICKLTYTPTVFSKVGNFEAFKLAGKGDE